MSGPLHLFEAFGIEVEAAIVDAATFDVRPVADELLRAASGGSEWTEDVDDGDIGWSNELVDHVVELKTAGPVARLDGVAASFLRSVGRASALLREHFGARLLPGGMHPWMDPARETVLWPHDHGPVYRAYDELFDCRRHGWANVQSVHLNLPFADAAELERLLAAARLVLPLIPALAASSPLVEGRATGRLDNRLEFYRTNSARVRSMTGDVIPEPLYEPERYRREVLGAIERELAGVGADPALLGGHEWTNARGAIVRFDRMAVEVRLLDAQESARSDLAVCAALTAVMRWLVEERGAPLARQRDVPSAPLLAQLRAAVDTGPATAVQDPAWAELFGPPGAGARTLGELLQRLVDATWSGPSELEDPLGTILREGTLAERELRFLGPAPDGRYERERLAALCARLCDCAESGQPFVP